MKIAVGADHGGVGLKATLIHKLRKFGYEVKDFGTDSKKSCDYPDFGFKVARAVGRGEYHRGILICKTGLGMTMVGNKIPGTRAALCKDEESVISSRKHNNANILVFGANFIDKETAWKWTKKWLSIEFEGGRHARRINKIKGQERR